MGQKADLVKKIVRNHEFWARADSISTGFALSAEGLVLAVYGIPAMPLLLGAAAGVGVAALLGCGAYSLYMGAKSTWHFIRGVHAKVYNKTPPAPLKQGPTLLQRLARHPRAAPLVQKLKKLPLAQKFLDSPVGKLRGGLSDPQRDAFMVALNVKGSLFVGGAAALFLVRHLIALPALTVGGIVTAATAIAAFYVGKSAFDIACNTRLLITKARERRAARKKTPDARPPAPPAAKPVVKPIPGPAAAAAPVFNKTAPPPPANPPASPKPAAVPPPSKPATPPPPLQSGP